MLPNNQSEGNSQAPAGAAEQPTSPTSGAETQPLPDYVTALQSQIAEVTTLVKGIQKGTDKQIGQVRGDIKRILELAKSGLDENAIQRELFLDQLMTGQNAPVGQPTGSGKQPDAGLDVEAVVKNLQFEPNDPALAALKIKYANKPQELLSAAADLRLAQLKSPSPSPASAPSQTGGVLQNKSVEQEVISNYEAELAKVPRGNTLAISNLKAKYRQLAREKGFILNI